MFGGSSSVSFWLQDFSKCWYSCEVCVYELNDMTILGLMWDPAHRLMTVTKDSLDSVTSLWKEIEKNGFLLVKTFYQFLAVSVCGVSGVWAWHCVIDWQHLFQRQRRRHDNVQEQHQQRRSADDRHLDYVTDRPCTTWRQRWRHRRQAGQLRRRHGRSVYTTYLTVLLVLAVYE